MIAVKLRTRDQRALLPVPFGESSGAACLAASRSAHPALRLVAEERGNALAGDAEEFSDLFHGVSVCSEGGGFGFAQGRADVMEGFDVGGDEGWDAGGNLGFDDIGEIFAGFEAREEVVNACLDLLGAVDVGSGHVVELAEHLDEAAVGSSGVGGHDYSLAAGSRVVNNYCRNDY